MTVRFLSRWFIKVEDVFLYEREGKTSRHESEIQPDLRSAIRAFSPRVQRNCSGFCSQSLYAYDDGAYLWKSFFSAGRLLFIRCHM